MANCQFISFHRCYSKNWRARVARSSAPMGRQPRTIQWRPSSYGRTSFQHRDFPSAKVSGGIQQRHGESAHGGPQLDRTLDRSFSFCMILYDHPKIADVQTCPKKTKETCYNAHMWYVLLIKWVMRYLDLETIGDERFALLKRCRYGAYKIRSLHTMYIDNMYLIQYIIYISIYILYIYYITYIILYYILYYIYYIIYIIYKI